jgi:hypothetical protein
MCLAVASLLCLPFKDIPQPLVDLPDLSGSLLRAPAVPTPVPALYLILSAGLIWLAATCLLAGAIMTPLWMRAVACVLLQIMLGGPSWQDGQPINVILFGAIGAYTLLRNVIRPRPTDASDIIILGALMLAAMAVPIKDRIDWLGDNWIYRQIQATQMAVLAATIVAMPMWFVLTARNLAEFTVRSATGISKRVAGLDSPATAMAIGAALAMAQIFWVLQQGVPPGSDIAAALGIVIVLVALERAWPDHADSWSPAMLTLLLAELTVIVGGALIDAALPGLMRSTSGGTGRIDRVVVATGGGALLMVVGALGMLLPRRYHLGNGAAFLCFCGFLTLTTTGNPLLLVPGATSSGVRFDPASHWRQLQLVCAAAGLGAVLVCVFRPRVRIGTHEYLVRAVIAIGIIGIIQQIFAADMDPGDLLTLGELALILSLPLLGAFGLNTGGAAGSQRRRLILASLAPAAFGIVVVGSLNLVQLPGVVPSDLGVMTLLAISLIWDAAMSGQRFTNHEGRILPRVSRILWYLTYLLLLSATAVYFFGTPRISVTSSTMVDQGWVAFQSFNELGIPLILFLLIRAGRAIGHRHETHP